MTEIVHFAMCEMIWREYRICCNDVRIPLVTTLGSLHRGGGTFRTYVGGEPVVYSVVDPEKVTCSDCLDFIAVVHVQES